MHTISNKYLTKNVALKSCLFILDFILGIMFKSDPVQKLGVPNKILLGNGAHIGDVIISTALLPILKAAFPNVKIGFVVGSWSADIIKNNPMVDYVHIVDHWKMNRQQRSFFYKVARHRQTKKRSLYEIRRIGYDVGIELYSYLPNMIPLFWQAKIPAQIGYTSGGCGPLLTSKLDFKESGKHESDYQASLLGFLPIEDAHYCRKNPAIPLPSEKYQHDIMTLLKAESLDDCKYRIIHMGSSGSHLKKWPINSWRNLVEKLVSNGNVLVFTGTGDRELADINEVTNGLDNCINLCGKLRLQIFVELIRHAQLIYSIDTSAGHIASALGTPCISIYGGIADIGRWRPMGNRCIIVTKKMKCAPCMRKHGCKEMTCISGIDFNAVYEAGQRICATK